MAIPLNILIAEDNPNDAELVLGQLREAGFDPKWKCVQTEADFLTEIRNSPDIILSDFSMPQFTGLRAAELLRESGLNIPFILVSGTVGEEIAVEAMKYGATDYLLKDRIARLGHSVKHALEEKRLRHERKQAEEAFTAERNLLRAVIDLLPDCIYVKDTQGRFLLSNEACAAVMGAVSPAELIGKADKDFYSPELAAEFQADEQAILKGIPLINKEEPATRPDGTKEFILTTKLPLKNSSGKIIGLVGCGRNVTGQRKLEDQLRQSQKMEAIGQLASGVAHDFNNILSVIQMQAELIKSEDNPSPAQLEFAKETSAAAQRGAALTRQLLLFSRKEAMQLRDLDLNESISNMTKMLRRTLGENIQLQFKFAMQPLFVHADAGMMDQVLMNLAVNSRDAMPEGGQLVIETSAAEFDEFIAAQLSNARPGSFVCLSVSDTGCGISPRNLPRIFEPFFTTKEVGKGTGLGLATVFGIVQQHKGWIDVYSEVGKGTAFRIYLPRLARISNQKFVTPMTEPARGGNETILLVEDESSLCASMRGVLSRLGYNVLEATDGNGALELWKQCYDQIHLLLIDMVIPGGINGKELSERFLKENPKLKVIYTSGYGTEVTGKDFQLEEGVNFLPKPFEAHKLAQTVRHCLDKI